LENGDRDRQGVLADQVGVDAFGVEEHHRPDFAVFTPDIVLAAIAGSPKEGSTQPTAGLGLHWEELDEDISVAGLLAGHGDMTKRTTEAASS
jgi:hypothetical protein